MVNLGFFAKFGLEISGEPASFRFAVQGRARSEPVSLNRDRGLGRWESQPNRTNRSLKTSLVFGPFLSSDKPAQAGFLLLGKP